MLSQNKCCNQFHEMINKHIPPSKDIKQGLIVVSFSLFYFFHKVCRKLQPHLSIWGESPRISTSSKLSQYDAILPFITKAPLLYYFSNQLPPITTWPDVMTMSPVALSLLPATMVRLAKCIVLLFKSNCQMAPQRAFALMISLPPSNVYHASLPIHIPFSSPLPTEESAVE